MEMEAPEVLWDLNTPEEYQRVLARRSSDLPLRVGHEFLVSAGWLATFIYVGCELVDLLLGIARVAKNPTKNRIAAL